jgi:hypothetical protein
MDIPQYNSVLDLLSALPDPRKPRGKQIEWTFIWMIIFAGMLHNQRGATAIAHWARCHRETLVATFRPAKNRLPSESTIRRAIQQVDAALLDGLLARLQSPPPAPDPLPHSSPMLLMANMFAVQVLMATPPSWSVWLNTPRHACLPKPP